MTAALAELRDKLKEWNKNTFGNVFRRKKRNSLRLAGVERALESRTTEGLLKLEFKLKKGKTGIATARGIALVTEVKK